MPIVLEFGLAIVFLVYIGKSAGGCLYDRKAKNWGDDGKTWEKRKEFITDWNICSR